jgi:hypothetical protein
MDHNGVVPANTIASMEGGNAQDLGAHPNCKSWELSYRQMYQMIICSRDVPFMTYQVYLKQRHSSIEDIQVYRNEGKLYKGLESRVPAPVG